MHMANASNNVSILAINFSKTSLIFFGKKKIHFILLGEFLQVFNPLLPRHFHPLNLMMN